MTGSLSTTTEPVGAPVHTPPTWKGLMSTSGRRFCTFVGSANRMFGYPGLVQTRRAVDGVISIPRPSPLQGTAGRTRLILPCESSVNNSLPHTYIFDPCTQASHSHEPADSGSRAPGFLISRISAP